LLTSHNQQLGSGVNNIQFTENGRSVGGQDHLLQVVDDDLVAAIGTQGSLNGAGDGLAGLDVADNSSILRVMAVLMEL
jgi:hypothetical protein